ncbi:tetratricopeptide repeat protein [Roseivivax sp. GX 12232]|uniref:heme biosynthesis protein HemY n=1 Tax=Roseivivax sp. GX 12232 TaxID=2900547 RepID=UPI001E2F100E|nr:heme biosynthesis HemY N-terminal domain-containing protein [Roseivivax sp. GX 12232]MCE0506310.1 tetratricopeptide repeat protein [Roseivivax sp. GX 12232]
MLWSLIKIVLFVAIVAALTLGASYLMESEGGVQITVAGMEFTLGPLQSVIAAVVLFVVVWLVLKLASLLVAVLRFINGDQTAISRYFDRNRERKGYQALGDGLTALASGEGRLALAKAQKAERYLHRPELTDLLQAQAAEQMGDRKKAEEVYKRLLKTDATRFVGVRGIMKQRLASGDTETALRLAERAFAIKPKHEEVQDTLLSLQARKADWAGARRTLAAKLKHGSMPRDLHKRRDAVLALSEARDILDEGKDIEAREAAISANKASPDLIPAAAMAARGFIADGRKKNATRLLKKAWQAQPHPELAAAFAEIEPAESPAERLRRFSALTSIQPEHRETRLLLAELHLAAEDFPGARRAVGELWQSEPDARVLTMMAAIERGEGSEDAIVRGWLAKALTAPRGPQWVCENCNNIQTEWSPICNNCDAFDSLSWRTPPKTDVTLPAGAEMLPLLVGPSVMPPDEAELVAEEPEVEDAAEASETSEAAPSEPASEAEAAPEENAEAPREKAS